MNTPRPRRRLLVLATAAAFVATIGALASPMLRPPATGAAVVPADLGHVGRASDLHALIDVPGPVEVDTVLSATWAVPLSGLVNLEHPSAKAAGLTDRDEPIHIALHAIRHPDRGLFLVDTGVEGAFRDAPDDALLRGIVARVMHIERLTVQTDTKSFLEAERAPPAGVFLTHLHADHVTGLRDVPAGTRVYVGPGEASARSVENLVTRPIIDRALAGKGPVREWRFEPDPDGEFDGVLDVFGDGTVWALHVPGHTPGSTAFVARTPRGPVLLTGDASHTAWGWEHGVEPGTFSHDGPKSGESLARLRAFAEKHPGIDVRLGHQPREASNRWSVNRFAAE